MMAQNICILSRLVDGIDTRKSYQESVATRAVLMLIVIVAIYA